MSVFALALWLHINDVGDVAAYAARSLILLLYTTPVCQSVAWLACVPVWGLKD